MIATERLGRVTGQVEASGQKSAFGRARAGCDVHRRDGHHLDGDYSGYQVLTPQRSPSHRRDAERDQLNRILRGWSNYFGYGTRLMAYRAVDNYVYERVQHFLRQRHKVSSRGTTSFSDAVVFGRLGVLRLRHVHVGRLS
jgi:hypothetical protein